LYLHVPTMALAIHVVRHFCYRMYHSATKHSKRLKAQQTSGVESRADFSLKLCWPVTMAIIANRL